MKKINFYERVSNFKAEALSGDGGLTRKDAEVVDRHFHLGELCSEDIANLRDFITLYFTLMVKGLNKELIEQKFMTLNKLTAVMDLRLGKVAQRSPEDVEI